MDCGVTPYLRHKTGRTHSMFRQRGVTGNQTPICWSPISVRHASRPWPQRQTWRSSNRVPATACTARDEAVFRSHRCCPSIGNLIDNGFDGVLLTDDVDPMVQQEWVETVSCAVLAMEGGSSISTDSLAVISRAVLRTWSVRPHRKSLAREAADRVALQV